MDIIGLIGLALILLAILGFVHLLALSTAAEVVLLIVGVVLIAWGGRGYWRSRV
jgi:arginine exporter protein ArgO